MDPGMPPLTAKKMFETNPLKSRFSVRELTVVHMDAYLYWLEFYRYYLFKTYVITKYWSFVCICLKKYPDWDEFAQTSTI